MNILHQEWTSKNCRVMSSGPRKFCIARRVGHDQISYKKSFEPDLTLVISNDRSLYTLHSSYPFFSHAKCLTKMFISVIKMGHEEGQKVMTVLFIRKP